MNEYKNIMKLVDNKLAEDEMRIKYLREENERLMKEIDYFRCDNDSLGRENTALMDEVKRQDAVIQELKNAVKVVSKND